MAHEGAHAVVASAMGFTVLGVTIDSDGSGVTSYLGRRDGLRRLLTSFAGCLGPSAFGLCAAKLVETGRVVTVLWVATILLVLLLFLVRKSFGIVSVPLSIALLALLMRYTHEGFQEVVAYAMTWLLLLSGARTAMVHGADATDAGTLADISHLPRRLWSLLWIAGTLLAVVVGGKWVVLRRWRAADPAPSPPPGPPIRRGAFLPAGGVAGQPSWPPALTTWVMPVTYRPASLTR